MVVGKLLAFLGFGTAGGLAVKAGADKIQNGYHLPAANMAPAEVRETATTGLYTANDAVSTAARGAGNILNSAVDLLNQGAVYVWNHPGESAIVIGSLSLATYCVVKIRQKK